MYFDATPMNMTELLVMVPAFIAIVMLMRKKYDTNMPLLFYFAAVAFTNWADRPVEPLLMYGSLGCAMMLRFEFMNNSFSKFIAFFTIAGLTGVLWSMMTDILA